MRRSDAILVLTSGLNREVAAGRGLEPAARVSGVARSASHTLSEKASSSERVFARAGCVCRLAASEGGCNTLDPRFISQRVCLSKKKEKENQESKLKEREGQERRKRREKRRRKAELLK